MEQTSREPPKKLSTAFWMRWWFFALIILTVAILFYLYSRKSVQVTKLIRGPAIQSVYATGTVEGTVMLPLAARNPGRIVELNSDEGRPIIQGEILARLEDQDLRQALEEAKAAEQFARIEHERNLDMIKAGAVSQQSRQRTESEWLAAQARLARAESLAEFMQITAPFNGQVIRRDGEIGEMIAANETIFWVTDSSGLRITAEVDEEDIALVHSEQRVLIRADAFPNRVFESTVQSVTPKGDPIARSYRVRMALDPALPLKIGMTAEVNIVTQERQDALLLKPQTLDGMSVWIAHDGRLLKRTLETGARGEEYIEVLHGLSENDLIVLNPSQSFRENQRVRTVIVE